MKAPPPDIPDHEMLRVIGEGSYGEVWLARNAVGTRRAVKVIHRERFDSARPFEREFTGLQKYEPVSRSHDGLVDVLQLGRNDGAGYFYYIMELADDAAADGGDYRPLTLRKAIDLAGRLAPAECVRHFIGLAGALDHLHRHGLIHRDVKPSNIIFVGGVAKLADIGLVAEMSESRSYVGTEGYIPPEGPGSGSADIFSLGKVLYESFTGQDRMSYPSLPVELRGGGPATQAALEVNAIALRACEPQPEKRYATAGQVAGDLALLQSGRSIKGLRLIEGRLRALRATIIAGIGVIVIALSAAWFSKRQARAESERAAREQVLRERAEQSEQRTRGAVFSQALALARAECLSPRMGRRFRALDAIAAVAADHPGNAELRNAAITALALPDVRPTGTRPAGSCVDAAMRRLAVPDKAGALRVYTLGGSAAEDVLEGVLPDSAGCRIAGPFSPDGHRLAAFMPDKSCMVWDAERRTVLSRIPPEIAAAAYERCEFTPGGGALLLLQPGGLLIHPLDGTKPELIALPCPADTLSSNGGVDRFAVSAKSGRRVAVVDVPLRRVVQEFETPVAAFNCVLSPDHAWLLVCGPSGGTHRYCLAEPGSAPESLNLHDGTCNQGSFHPDSDVLLTSSWDGTMALSGMGEAARLVRHASGGRTFVWHPEGRRAAWLNGTGGELILAETAGRSVCRVISLPASERAGFQFGSVAFTPDGNLLAVSGADGVRFFETRRGAASGRVAMPGVTSVAFTAAGTMLASTSSGLMERNVSAAEESRTLHAGQNPFILSGDGSTTALMTRDGIAVRRGDSEFNVVPGTRSEYNRACHLSRDGGLLCVRGDSCRVWSTHTGIQLCTVRIGGSPCFAGVPPLLIGGQSDASFLEARDPATGDLRWRTPLPSVTAEICMASPDGRLAVVAVSDGSLLLVETATGRIPATLAHPDARLIRFVSFSPDSRQIAAATAAGTVLLWHLPQLRSELAPLGLDW